jgi:FkbM family methyltransferase
MALNDRLAVPYRLRDAVSPPIPGRARRWVQFSFAQAGEDLMIKSFFSELGIVRPSYLDIGAFHPYALSNTALLHLGGSRGINVEPNPDAAAFLARERPEDITLNIGCAPEPGVLPYYRLTAPALNTFSEAGARQAAEASEGRSRIETTVEIEVQTVPMILEQHFGGHCPDFVSIDVEGLDIPILETLPDWPERPIVFCVETARYSERTNPDARIPEVSALLRTLGYLPLADTLVNTLFADEARWRAVAAG